MHNFVLSPIDPELLINSIAEKVTEKILKAVTQQEPEADELLTIQQAGQLINLTVPTIYGLVSRAEIPVSKKGKRLYFSKLELMDWVKSGRKKTVSEISAEADSYVSRKR